MTADTMTEPQPLPSELLLQRFLVDAPLAKRPLYWRAKRQSAVAPQVTAPGDGTLVIGGHTSVSFDSYFNSFFEGPWRRATALGRLTLRLAIQGDCDVRVYRRAMGEKVLVAEQQVSGPSTEFHFDGHGQHFRQHGVLSVELATRDAPVQWRGGEWVCPAVATPPVGLALVFCTFNREDDIVRILGCLCDDRRLTDRLTRLYVVNQGQPFRADRPDLHRIAHRLGAKLRVLEQGNFGGAGGFGRGLMACLEDPEVTHAALLDDDIELEPDCILRMASFFRLAKSDVAVGGQMLDAVQPTRLYEAGAVISERHWAFQPQSHNLDLADPRSLAALGQPNPVHYNGWWCCGFPLSVIRQVGLPLPCFIRGDDVELGLRLHQQGVPTLSLAGVGVWHQPFYLKLGGWQIYYETRNMLITAALHQPLGRWPVVRRMLRHFLVHLLTLRYYSAALILQGINDFLAGPGVLEGSPLRIHAGLQAQRQRYPAAETSREQVIHEQPPGRGRPLRGRAAFLWVLVKLLAHHALVPTRPAAVRLLPVERFNWPTMQGIDHVAVETWWDEGLPTFRRSREHFRRLGRDGLASLWRLYAHGPTVAAAWRADFPRLASVPFWKSYLGIAAETQPAEKVPEVAE